MSASREKKQRRGRSDASEELNTKTTQNEGEKDNTVRYRVATIAVIVALVLSVALFVYQGFVAPNSAAVTVGGEKVYDHELNYYYINSYSNFVNQVGADYAASLFGLDATLPLDRQTYYADETMTWHDYFLNTAKTSAQQIRMLSDAAAAEGVTLNEEYEGYVTQEMDALATFVEDNDYDMNSYLSAMYGSRMDETEYEALVRRGYLASQYSTDKLQSLADTTTTEEIDAYYTDHKNDFDFVTYRRYLVNANITDEMSEEEQTAALDTARATAESMAAASTNEAEFIAQVVAYQNRVNEQVAAEAEPDEDGNLPEVVVYTSENAETDTLRSEVTYSSFGSVAGANLEQAEWLFDADRAVGDVTTVDTTNGTYVCFFMDRARHDYNTVDVRHILIDFTEFDAEGNPVDPNAEADDTTTDTTTTDTTTDTTVTDAQDAAAKAEAERILAEYEAGEKTEESFAELAKQYSFDSNAADGGIYEEVYRGQMVTNFETWCFGSGRQPGDTGIVSTEYGYHVMYFSGENIPYWQAQVRNAKANEDYTAWETEQLANYEVDEKGGISNVGLN